MDIHWKDIADKLKFKVSNKLAKDTIVAFYTAFEASIDVDCNIRVRHIGKFKGTPAGVRRKKVLKKYNKPKVRHSDKIKKRRQRMWAKEEIDKYWPE